MSAKYRYGSLTEAFISVLPDQAVKLGDCFGESPWAKRIRSLFLAYGSISEKALIEAINHQPLQLTDTPPESERQILRCAPPFDAQAEHENDLRQESLREFYEQEQE